MTIKLGIIGAAGRMGKQIIACALCDPSFLLSYALVKEHSELENVDIGSLIGKDPVGILCSSEKKLPLLDVLIDFSAESCLIENLEMALKKKIPLVIGTTGLSSTQKNAIKDAAQKIPIFFAPNFSLGMAATVYLTKNLSLFLTTFTPSITEVHHIHKKDSPSGSALHLAETISQKMLNPPPSIHSIREGEVIGKHSISFKGKYESLDIVHDVISREAFAEGALAAAKFLIGKKPSLYNMEDLLQFTIKNS